MPESQRSILGPVAGDMNLGTLNRAGTPSGPSVGASSLVTDANSVLCSGPQLQRSNSINNEPYMSLPPSPMSISSNNIAGSPVMEGSSVVQQSPHQEGLNNQEESVATSETVACETANSLNAPKRIRTDMRPEDILQQQVIQQNLPRSETMQQSGQQKLQQQAILQQQRFAQYMQQQQQQQQQRQLLQSFIQLRRASLSLQPQQQQMFRQHLQQQAVQGGTPFKYPLVSGICSRRLKQYLYHQRQRPQDNNIHYWKRFVSEYFAPQAKERFCLSMYANISNQAPCTTRQSAKESWDCNLCGSKFGKGFETNVEELPRLCEIKFEGVNDENLFLDIPRETQLPSGLFVLEYAKAVQESVYKQLHVVREGQLRLMFTQDLKILSWEFCTRRHEDFFPRRTVSPQVNQLLQVSHKYQSTVGENGVSRLSHQNLQATCNTFLTAGCQLAKILNSPSFNDFGFPKRYDRFLQVYEVVNSMKSLIDFSQGKNIGPIESLKNYSRIQSEGSRKLQESGQLMSQVLPANPPTEIHQASIEQMNCNLATTGVFGSNQQNVPPLNNYQNVNLCPNQNDLRQESSNINGLKQAVPAQFHSSAASILTNTNANSLSQQQQQLLLNGCLTQHNNMQPSVSQYKQQNAIQQMQRHAANNVGVQQYQNHAPYISGTLAARDTSRIGTNNATVSRMESQSSNNGTDVQNTSASLHNNTAVEIPRGSYISQSADRSPRNCSNSFDSCPDSPLGMESLESLAQEFIESGWFNDDCWWQH